MPFGASGSSTINAKDSVSPGMSFISKGGLMSFPSQVYFFGIFFPFSNFEQDILIFYTILIQINKI